MEWPRQRDARGENTKINYGLDTTGEKEKRTSTSKKNVDGRITSGHDNKKFRTGSVEKQRGMAFGFRKTVTAVKRTWQIDSWIEQIACKHIIYNIGSFSANKTYTVKCYIFISVFDQHDAQICFTVSFISCLYMFRAHVLIIRSSKLQLHSLWYHHTVSCTGWERTLFDFLITLYTYC